MWASTSTERILYSMFPFFASFIVIVIFVTLQLHKHKKFEQNASDEFRENEIRANSTRRKSLDDLAYISIPIESLPLNSILENDVIREQSNVLHSLYLEKIVNLSEFNNTDLKFKYGVANLPDLTKYDENYASLVSALERLAEEYYKEKHLEEAIAFLEFSLQTKCDVLASYKLLATIYMEQGKSSEIPRLLAMAKIIPGFRRASIERMLQAFCQ